MLGIMMMRYVVRVEPLASATVETLVTLVAPTLQRHLAGEPEGPAQRGDAGGRPGV